LGVAAYWRDCSFGLLDLTGNRVEPWTQMEATQDGLPRDELIRRGLEFLEFDPTAPSWGIVVFMDPPPSDAAASGFYRGAVLDWNAPFSHMAHEIGHVLGFAHSCGQQQEDYGDPYCIMSAHIFGGENPTFFADLSELDPDVPAIYWNEMGPRPAAATLYTFLDEFAKSSAVVRVDRNEATPHPRRLKALSSGGLEDPLMAVMRIGDRDWTAEYREASSWDRSLDPAHPRNSSFGSGAVKNYGPAPGAAVVIHAVEQTRNQEHPLRPCFQGRIRVPFEKGIRDWQSSTEDVRVVVDSMDAADHSVRIRFTRRVKRAVTLETQLGTLPEPKRDPRMLPGFMGKATFPIGRGLCGEGTFTYLIRQQRQELNCRAALFGGWIDPVYAWDRRRSCAAVRDRDSTGAPACDRAHHHCLSLDRPRARLQGARDPPHPHPPLPPAHQRQGRALHPHDARRLGLRGDLPRLTAELQPAR
jgi:hypothetical protein